MGHEHVEAPGNGDASGQTRALAARGVNVVPDLPGYGHSPVRRPGTWAMHVAAVEEVLEQILDEVVPWVTEQIRVGTI